MPAVMNRSDAFWCAISLRKEVKSMVVPVVLMRCLREALLRSVRCGAFYAAADSRTGGSFEQALVLGVLTRVRTGDQAALDQVLQVLVERHHSVVLAGL